MDAISVTVIAIGAPCSIYIGYSIYNLIKELKQNNIKHGSVSRKKSSLAQVVPVNNRNNNSQARGEHKISTDFISSYGDDIDDDNIVEDSKLYSSLKDNPAFLSALIPKRKVVRDKVIGIGSLGKVYDGDYHGTKVAIKVLSRNVTRGKNVDSIVKLSEQHLNGLIQVRHPNLVLCMGLCFPSSEEIYLVNEYMDNGSLFSYIHSETGANLKWKDRLEILKQVSQALLCLHTCPSGRIVHGKLNTLNILLDRNMVAKVSDYGLEAFRALVRNTEVVVQPYWSSPEMLTTGKPSFESDVYSFGMMIWEMLTNQIPLKSSEITNIDIVQDILKGKRPDIPENCPKVLKSLLKKCWSIHAKNRPTFEEIFNVLSNEECKTWELPNDLIISIESPNSMDISPKIESLNGAHQSLAAAEQWIVDRHELKLGDIIDIGASGKVFKAQFRGKDVAVKMMKSQKITEELYQKFANELKIMCSLRHPNTILFIGAVIDSNLSIVMEYCSRGSLHKILHDRSNHVDYNLIVKLSTDIAQGMNYLHLNDPPIIHRDLKSLNILVDENWTAKVCDFGITEVKSDAPSNKDAFAGTPFWLAPETLSNSQFSEKSDVYAYGMILWELFSRQTPFPNKNPHQAALAVLHDDERPIIPAYVPPKFTALIEKCWTRDPNERPGFEEILEVLKIILNEGLPRLELDKRNAKCYRKKQTVYAFKCSDSVVVSKTWGTGKSKPGDWIIVGPNDDVYTCAADIFEKTYVRFPPEPQRYRKTGFIYAKEMDEAFLVETLEGTENGEKGDFLAQNPADGEQWPISKQVMLNMYEEISYEVAIQDKQL